MTSLSNWIERSKFVTRLTRSRPRGWRSLVYNSAMHRFRRPGPLLPPVHVSIEPTNACNARCPVCETGKREMTRPTGMLDLHAYRQLIDQIWPTTNSLMFYFMGEPFVNPHAYDMIRYARDHGIFVETCTNGDFVDAKGVLYSDINKIAFQIGGMDEATHQRYRIRSSLEKAKRAIHEVLEERRHHPDSNVQVEVGFIVMRHNEHQVDDFIDWARDVGVDRANVVDPCARNMLEAHAYLPKDRKYWFYDEEAFERGVLKPKVVPNNECVWIWNSIMINWNGDAVPCCRDPLGLNVYGNVFEQGLLPVFNGKHAREFRRKVLTDQGSIGICSLCSGYGMPDLVKPQPASFQVTRHTVNVPTLEQIDAVDRTHSAA